MSDARDSTEMTADVQIFLRDKIKSHEHLDVLLVLRSQRSRTWSSKTVAQAMQVRVAVVAEVLDQLCDARLVVRSGDTDHRFQYGPADQALSELADQFFRAYEHNPAGVMSLMNARALDRVRGEAIHRLANALVFGHSEKK